MAMALHLQISEMLPRLAHGRPAVAPQEAPQQRGGGDARCSEVVRPLPVCL
eukprot:CAMPEP_0176193700 /NCGR_PEP_ID=MMETSP0121_2-20121125/5621_1 /TAXON_ID=160619 /ORGANISM="Kryptoperidinium foliaceum, Strain CCMP 1326" /LENGTH=50 /DNA_ID=CAMNT_0017532425 /DNA_START=167 /DNA_END=315 /DNA_ORIENTATION=+